MYKRQVCTCVIIIACTGSDGPYTVGFVTQTRGVRSAFGHSFNQHNNNSWANITAQFIGFLLRFLSFSFWHWHCTLNVCVFFSACWVIFVFPIHRTLNLSTVFLTCVCDLLASGYTREVGRGGWGGGGRGEGEMRGREEREGPRFIAASEGQILKREVSERSARCNFEAVAQYSPLRQARLA